MEYISVCWVHQTLMPVYIHWKWIRILFSGLIELCVCGICDGERKKTTSTENKNENNALVVGAVGATAAATTVTISHSNTLSESVLFWLNYSIRIFHCSFRSIRRFACQNAHIKTYCKHFVQIDWWWCSFILLAQLCNAQFWWYKAPGMHVYVWRITATKNVWTIAKL